MAESRRVRVLFVCASGGAGRLQLGGAERFLVEVLPALQRSCEVMAVVSDARLQDVLRSQGVATTLARPARRVDLRYLSTLRRAVAQFRPDVVSAHLLSAAMHARAAAALLPGPPLVVTLHNSIKQYIESGSGSGAVRDRTNLLLDRTLRAVVPHASVAVSRYELAELERVRPARPVTLIHNALPASWSAPATDARRVARVALGLPVQDRLVVFLGRLEREKGADLLPGIARRLAGTATLVAVGDGIVPVDGPGLVRYPRTITPELFYDAADVVLVPSRVESFGRVALEAVARARPVVHTGAGGLAELLGPAEGVLAFRTSDDEEGLAGTTSAVLTKLTGGLTRPEAREDLARHYREAYGFAGMVEAWQRLLLATAGARW